MHPLLLLALLPAQAQEPPVEPMIDIAYDAVVLSDPLPLRGDPWDLVVTRFVLPPQDVSWLTTTDVFRACVLEGTLAPGAEPTWQVRECPEPMVPAAQAAVALWRFAPAPGAEAEGPTRFELRFVVRYAEQLATMTTHAQLDPGTEAAFDGAEGVPGVKLAHPAALVKLKAPKVPGKAKKAGVAPQACDVVLMVEPNGEVAQPDAAACPEALREAAIKAATRARYSPRVVDGMTEEQKLTVEVSFR
ncbi:MAG: energy transducer TonB [Pseudomonadota bacterium]